MKQLVTLVAALLVSGTLIGATTARAETAGGYYHAVPAAHPTKSSFVTRSTAWRLRNGTFVAARAPERDMVLCQLVAQRAGALAGFSAGGKAYDAAALGQCNARVKPVVAEVASTAGSVASGQNR